MRTPKFLNKNELQDTVAYLEEEYRTLSPDTRSPQKPKPLTVKDYIACVHQHILCVLTLVHIG